MGPKTPHSTVLSSKEEAIIVAFRKHTLLPRMMELSGELQVRRDATLCAELTSYLCGHPLLPTSGTALGRLLFPPLYCHRSAEW